MKKTAAVRFSDRAVVVVSLIAVLLGPAVSLAASPVAIQPVPRVLFLPVPGPSFTAPTSEDRPRDAVFVEVGSEPTPEPLPVLSLPVAQPVAVARFAPVTPVVSSGGAHRISGKASWYCLAGRSSCMAAHPDGPGADLYAAAGPALRLAMGGGRATSAPDPWRGRVVTISANGRSVRVRLSDWCACLGGSSSEKVIDLYHDVWVALGIPGGTNTVTIRW